MCFVTIVAVAAATAAAAFMTAGSETEQVVEDGDAADASKVGEETVEVGGELSVFGSLPSPFSFTSLPTSSASSTRALSALGASSSSSTRSNLPFNSMQVFNFMAVAAPVASEKVIYIPLTRPDLSNLGTLS